MVGGGEQRLPEQIPPVADSESDPLYQAALAVEQDAALVDEMAAWEAATLRGGLTQ